MKKIIIIFLTNLSIVCFGQTDTIYTLNGEILSVNISKINESSIEYSYPKENLTIAMRSNSVVKIHFKSGRIQNFSTFSNTMNVKSCLDWENVQISNIPSEVEGLSKIDYVGSRSKGNTIFSNSGRLQDKAFNKIKMKTAMIGGNVVYMLGQGSEKSKYLGTWGSSLPTSLNSGLAYTTNKVSINEIVDGDYVISKAYVLYANQDNFDNVSIRPQTIIIEKSSLLNENNFYRMNFVIKPITNSKGIEFTIIYADNSEIVLSAIKSSSGGKKTYYNLILEKL